MQNLEKIYNKNNKIFGITRQGLFSGTMLRKIGRKLIKILQKINLENKKI